ncbi:FecR domain-containing protein [Paenibacillus sp. GCM10012307]|uniref:FecR domain-containing protein n=1 Tax=Paenibacillus roseus TaxID=2798579 RepID=A0A934MTA2_9BACL|nr:FecR family protein [Paenibacillus roseus]MBJ6359862.1 FecR domain-containing protein [Paenibacillus roseus]
MRIRKILLSVLAMLLLAGPLSILSGAREAAAEAVTRVAVLQDLKGDVKVKKSGGSKAFKAFKKMSLNEGDTLTTGAGASAVLALSSKDSDEDTVTVGENSQVDFTKLSDDKGVRSKMNIWAGSMWVKVKSISNASDTFEIETPTSIMGVRGTQFYVEISPETGVQKTVVFAGIVQVATSGAKPGSFYVYPFQNLLMAEQDGSIQTQSAFVDVKTFLNKVSPEIIAKMIQDAANIHAENVSLIAKLKERISRGETAALSDLPQNLGELARYEQNLSNLIGNLIKQAATMEKIPLSELEKLVDAVNQQLPIGKKIDLDKVEEFKFTDQEKAKMQQAAQLEKESKARLDKERKQKEEERKKQEELLKALRQDKAKQAELNRLKEEALRKAAEEALKKTFSEEEKKRFEESKKILEPGTDAQPPSAGGGAANPAPDAAARLGFSSPASSGVLTDPAPGTAFNLELQFQGFVNSRSIAGYQVRLEYDSDYVAFQSEKFLSDPLPYRQSRGVFNVEPEGAVVDGAQSVDYVNASPSVFDSQTGTVFYAVSKFTGNAVSIPNWTTVVKLPFAVRDVPIGSRDVKFRIVEIIAINASGDPVQTIKVGDELNLKLTRTNNGAPL